MQPSSQKALNFFDMQKNWKKYLLWGTAIIGGILCLRYLRNVTEDHRKISGIMEKIQESYEKAEQSLCPLTVEREKNLKDQNLEMLCMFVSNLKKKQQNKEVQMKNPFVPPFQKGIMIGELPPNHRLLFNKFNFYKHHLLIVTKQFRQQTERLSLEDFQQAVYVMKALNGSFFFNCGQNSGCSQPHKHIQLLPSPSLNLPIMMQISQSVRKNELKLLRVIQRDIIVRLYTFTPFQFIHGIVPIKKSDKVSELSQCFKDAELSLLSYFKDLFKERAFAYNLIGTEEFLLIVPRKKEKFGDRISINAVGFMGSFLLKDENTFNRIQYMAKPSQILKEITFTELQ